MIEPLLSALQHALRCESNSKCQDWACTVGEPWASDARLSFALYNPRGPSTIRMHDHPDSVSVHAPVFSTRFLRCALCHTEEAEFSGNLAASELSLLQEQPRHTIGCYKAIQLAT